MIESEYSNEYCDRCISLEKKSLELRNISSELLEEKAKLTYEYLETKSIADSRGFWMWLWFALFVLMVLIPKANAEEVPTTCARAKLSWEPPTTRQNGDALTIEELDYYTIQVVDMSSGEVTTSTVSVEDYIYIEDRPYVRDVNDKPITEYWYMTKPDDEYLREGEQCFRIKVKDTDGLESVWSDYACKELCAWNNSISLNIKIGIMDK